MAEPPPHKSTCTAPLLAVSAGCGENVWQAVLGTKDRWSLMGVSKSTQALFSPAVESLSYKLKQEEKDVQRPIPPILKDVQPRRLKIWGLSKKKQEEEGDDGSTYSKSLHAVSTAPHWSRLRCLVIQRVDLTQEVVHSLEPLLALNSLEELHLSGCELHADSLPHLVASRQLQRLELNYVKLIGGTEGASPQLAGPASITLGMAGIVTMSPDGEGQPDRIGSLLRRLAPRLRSIEYTCSNLNPADEVEQVLKVASEGVMPALKRLQLTHRPRVGWAVFEQYMRLLPAACPALQYLRLDNVLLPDQAMLPSFMAMSGLEHLELFALAPPSEWQPPSYPLKVDWPAGKDPMCLKLQLLSASSIPTLPFQHISKLRCEIMDMQSSADSTAAGESQKLRGVLEVLQAKGAVLQVGRIMGSALGGEHHAAGLSALLAGPASRIVFYRPLTCSLYNMVLDVAEIRAVAATWGSTLSLLTLKCKLTPAAWAAITAFALPQLKQLHGLYCAEGERCAFGAGLAALCMDWPRDRSLDVTVHPSSAAMEPVITACRSALEARGRTNVKITPGW